MSTSRCKRKTPIPDTITLTLKTPKSRQHLFSSEVITSHEKESQDREGTTQSKKSKRKKLRKTQNFAPIVDESDNEKDSWKSNEVKRTKLKSSSISTDSSKVGDVSFEEIRKSVEKPKIKKSKRKKFKLPEVNLDSPEGEEIRAQSPPMKISRKKKKALSDSISSMSDDAFSVEVCEEPIYKRKKTQLSDSLLINLDDLEILDNGTSGKNSHRKKFSSIESISSTSDCIRENTTKKKSKKKRGSNKANQQNVDIIYETRSSRKTQKEKKFESNIEIPYENKENVKIENAIIFENPLVSEKNRHVSNSQFMEETKKSRKNTKNLSSESDNKEIRMVENSRSTRKKNKISNTEDVTEELNENVQIPSVMNLRTSRKNSKTLNAETYNPLRESYGTNLNSENTEQEESEKNIHKPSGKKSRTSSRKCSRTSNSEHRDQTVVLEENIQMSSSKNLGDSRTNSTTFNSFYSDQSAESGENTDTPSSKKSRTSRDTSAIFNSTYTYQPEESDKNSEMPSIEEPMISRKSTSHPECSDQDREDDNFENNVVDEVTICNSKSNTLDENACKESGSDMNQKWKSPSKNPYKSPFGDLSNQQQGQRKRWTVMAINSKNDMEGKDEKRNTSLSANPSGRRSVRKRWSTELKKKFIESAIFPVEEIDESLVGIKTTEEQFVNTDNNDNHSIKSVHNSSTKSIASTQWKNVANADSPFTHNDCGEDDTADEVFTCHSEVEDYKKNSHDFSLRRHSKRYSKSLDLLEAIEPLNRTSSFENAEATFIVDDLQNPCLRKPQTPGSILKRRGTYDLDVSITDVSVLRSLSESNLSNSGLQADLDDSQGGKKNLRFQHVTKRKACIKNNVQSYTPEIKLEASNAQAINTKKVAPKLTAANKSVSFDQTVFSASSCSTSTPLHSLRKHTLLNQITTKEDLSPKSNKKRRSRSVDETRNKFVSRIRMPNFTKIHQRWLDKMEDISQMTKRKTERARLLLSGQNPTAQSTSISNDKIQKRNNNEPKHPKQLKFPKSNHIAAKEASTTYNTKNKNAEESKSKLQDKSKTQRIVSIKKNIPKTELESVNSRAKSDTKKIPVCIKPKTTQFDDILKRTEQIKSIATKSKPQHDIREEKRTILNGVRGNRRFELLMKMRNK